MIAVHILAVLAYVKDIYVPSERIARSVKTNPALIRQLLGKLKKLGLVKTREGSKGGARLAKVPEEIDLAAVYRAVEVGALFPLHPRLPNQKCPVGRNIQRGVRPILTIVEQSLLATLQSKTLQDAMKEMQL